MIVIPGVLPAAGSDSSGSSVRSASVSALGTPIWFFTFILLKFFSFRVPLPLFFSARSALGLTSLFATGLVSAASSLGCLLAGLKVSVSNLSGGLMALLLVLVGVS